MSTYQILFWTLFALTLLIFIVNAVFTPLIRKKMASKASKLQDEAISKIKAGDKVMLVSGIFGIIKRVHKRDFTLEISKNVDIRVEKQGVMGYFGEKPEVKKVVTKKK